MDWPSRPASGHAAESESSEVADESARQVVVDESWRHRLGGSDPLAWMSGKGNGGAGHRDPGSGLGGDLYGEQAWTAHVVALVHGDRRGWRHQAQLA
jgi:hypothetical protein